MSRKRIPPGFIEPCLRSPTKRPPSGPGWIHEIKQNGFRFTAHRDVRVVRLPTEHKRLRSVHQALQRDVGESATFDIGTMKGVTVGHSEIGPAGMNLSGSDLYTVIEHKCGGTRS
jgi:hypothetical protein